MPPSKNSLAAPRRDAGPEPLRRKRVAPAPAPSVKRRKLLNGLLAFATIVLLVDAMVGEKGFVERLRARRQYAQELAALAAIRQENAALREDVRRLRDDPSAIESIAREELGLIRPGELLFIVRDAK